MLYFYQNLPLHISPIAFTIGIFSIRWYALSYIVGFGVIYGLLIFRIKKREIPASISNFKFQISNLVTDFLLMSFFAALIGGRIGYVLCDLSSQQTKNLSGRCGINFWEWADFVIPAVPAGYFFGRVGNFLNGELYGRVTNSPLGMYFSANRTVLRWPSQLIEGFLEGIILFVILWAIRKKEMPKGSLFAIYFIGYGFFRILAEIFREPDLQIGLLFSYFTLGQLLSLVMVIVGAGLLLKKQKM